MTPSTADRAPSRAGAYRCRRIGPLDESAMTALARAISAGVKPPLTVYFRGDLGAGKTTFVRALVQGLGHPGRVKSPTYGLLEHYELPEVEVLHLDLYRIGDPGELDFLGIEDLRNERTVLLVEWPERGRGFLPEPDLLITLEATRAPAQHAHKDGGRDGDGTGCGRNITLFPHSPSGNTLCEFIDSLL